MPALTALATMDERKRDRMAPVQQEMEAGGVEYHPFAVSCWGRLHPHAADMLTTLSKRIARRDGGSSQRAVLTRLRSRIATADAARRPHGPTRPFRVAAGRTMRTPRPSAMRPPYLLRPRCGPAIRASVSCHRSILRRLAALGKTTKPSF